MKKQQFQPIEANRLPSNEELTVLFDMIAQMAQTWVPSNIKPVEEDAKRDARRNAVYLMFRHMQNAFKQGYEAAIINATKAPEMTVIDAMQAHGYITRQEIEDYYLKEQERADLLANSNAIAYLHDVLNGNLLTEQPTDPNKQSEWPDNPLEG